VGKFVLPVWTLLQAITKLAQRHTCATVTGATHLSVTTDKRLIRLRPVPTWFGCSWPRRARFHYHYTHTHTHTVNNTHSVHWQTVHVRYNASREPAESGTRNQSQLLNGRKSVQTDRSLNGNTGRLCKNHRR